MADYPEEVFDQVLAVHVRGSFLVCKHSLPYLKAGASAVITSSMVGLTSAAGICAYATAKHALVGDPARPRRCPIVVDRRPCPLVLLRRE